MNGAPSEPTRPPFPPPELRLGEAFPPGLGPRNGGALLAICDFVNRFGDVLGLWPCTVDELLSAGERLSTACSLWQQPSPGLMPVMACTLALCQHAQAAFSWWFASHTARVALCCWSPENLPRQCEGAMVCILGRFFLLGFCLSPYSSVWQPPPCQAEGMVHDCQLVSAVRWLGSSTNRADTQACQNVQAQGQLTICPIVP